MVERFLDPLIYYQRRARLRLARLGRARLTEERLARLLNELGVRSGGTVMVHSSHAAIQQACDIGPVELLGLLRRLLGANGTLLMPAFGFTGSMVDYLPTASRPIAVRGVPARTGLLCELLRRTPGVCHSLHPTHPVCGIGPAAEWLTSGHLDDDEPFGVHSPFARLCESDGLILGLGVDYRAFSAFHLADSLAVPGSESDGGGFEPLEHVECVDASRGRWTQPVRPFKRGLSRCFFRHALGLRRASALRSRDQRGVPFCSVDGAALISVVRKLGRQGRTPTNCASVWRWLERCWLPSY